jgi:hypothetical protein
MENKQRGFKSIFVVYEKLDHPPAHAKSTYQILLSSADSGFVVGGAEATRGVHCATHLHGPSWVGVNEIMK